MNSKIHGNTTGFLSALLSGSLSTFFFFPPKDFKWNFNWFRYFFNSQAIFGAREMIPRYETPGTIPALALQVAYWSGHASNCSPGDFSLKETFV